MLELSGAVDAEAMVSAWDERAVNAVVHAHLRTGRPVDQKPSRPSVRLIIVAGCREHENKNTATRDAEQDELRGTGSPHLFWYW